MTRKNGKSYKSIMIKKVPLKVKRKCYKPVVGPAMMYESGYKAINKKERDEIKVVEMRMLR